MKNHTKGEQLCRLVTTASEMGNIIWEYLEQDEKARITIESRDLRKRRIIDGERVTKV